MQGETRMISLAAFLVFYGVAAIHCPYTNWITPWNVEDSRIGHQMGRCITFCVLPLNAYCFLVGLVNVTSKTAGGSSPEDEYLGWTLHYVKFYKYYYYENEDFTRRNAPKELRMRREVVKQCNVTINVGELYVLGCIWYDTQCLFMKPYKNLTEEEKKWIGEKNSSHTL